VLRLKGRKLDSGRGARAALRSVLSDSVRRNGRRLKPGDGHGRLHDDLRRRLRDGYVPDVAELAVKVFGRRIMPVAHRMRGEARHGDQQDQH
jgi:hypothetical protein